MTYIGPGAWVDPIGGEVWSHVHAESACRGNPCVVHRPSKHSMSHLPRHLRETGLVERTCPHGIGHPDPDSLAFFEHCGIKGFDIHGCCGCCGP